MAVTKDDMSQVGELENTSHVGDKPDVSVFFSVDHEWSSRLGGLGKLCQAIFLTWFYSICKFGRMPFLIMDAQCPWFGGWPKPLMYIWKKGCMVYRLLVCDLVSFKFLLDVRVSWMDLDSTKYLCCTAISLAYKLRICTSVIAVVATATEPIIVMISRGQWKTSLKQETLTNTPV